MMEMSPTGGGGYIVGCLFDLTPPITDLVAGEDRELILATYAVDPSATGSTQLEFIAALHIPPVEPVGGHAGTGNYSNNGFRHD